MKNWILLSLVIAMVSVSCGCARSFAPDESDRVVCLGDSITDGCTYPQILMQALKEAGKPTPPMVCSGVASDTAPQMADRLDTSVLVYEPDLVTFNAGTNDSLRNESPEAYEKALREVVEKVKANGGTMILLTPCIISTQLKDGGVVEDSKERAEKAEKLVDEYEKIVRKVADEEGFPVAENRALMEKARAAGRRVMSDDGIHPNYFGQSLMARSILDAMGYVNVPLPNQFNPQLFPGVITEWKMRLAPVGDNKKPMVVDEKTVLTVEPNDDWKTYTLPDPVPADKPSAEQWWEQERRNGFGCRVNEVVGKGLVQAVTYIDAPEAKKAYINLGIGIQTAWLNGKKIHDQKGWTGFHAGKERIPVELKKGQNVLFVEITGNEFFVSVTDDLVWEKDLR